MGGGGGEGILISQVFVMYQCLYCGLDTFLCHKHEKYERNRQTVQIILTLECDMKEV